MPSARAGPCGPGLAVGTRSSRARIGRLGLVVSRGLVTLARGPVPAVSAPGLCTRGLARAGSCRATSGRWHYRHAEQYMTFMSRVVRTLVRVAGVPPGCRPATCRKTGVVEF